MSRVRRWRAALPSLETVGWIAVLLFLAFRVWPQLAAAMGTADPETSPPAPGFEAVGLDGAPVSLDSLRGQVVLVNFWATWCPPCRLEMPGFQSVYEKRRAEGFTIVGLSTDVGGDAPVRAFLEERGITYPVAMSNPALVRAYGGVPALPSSFLIDRQGRIRHEVRGMFTEIALDQAVARLLAEAP